MHTAVLSALCGVGNKWSCLALFIKLLVFLLLIKDFNSLTLTGRLSVLGGVQPPFLYRDQRSLTRRDLLYLVMHCYALCLSILASNVTSGIFYHTLSQMKLTLQLTGFTAASFRQWPEVKWEINTKTVLWTTEMIMVN